MKKTEIRIGNKVKLLGTTTEAFPSDFQKWYNGNTKDYPDFTGIELTSDILDKIGFSDKEYKTGNIGIDINNHSFVLQKPFFMGEWQKYYCYELTQYRFVELKYLHQLQNLFSDLENEELDCKKIF